MKAAALCGLAGVVGGGIYLNGAQAVGVAYPRPPEEVLRLVDRVEFPGYVEGMLDQAADGSGGSIDRTVEPGRVHFSLKVDDIEVATYDVTVVPGDPGQSRVTTSFAMDADAGRHMTDLIFPAAKQLATVGPSVLDESVDAALDGRPVNLGVYHAAMSGFTMANMREMQAGIQKQFAEVAKRMDEGARSTADDPSPPAVRPTYNPTVRFVPGKPMVSARVPPSTAYRGY